MPILNGQNVTDKEAFVAGFCPETGQPLKDIGDIDSHILHLWPLRRSPEAEYRIALLNSEKQRRLDAAAPKNVS